jgi:hypothetical protein
MRHQLIPKNYWQIALQGHGPNFWVVGPQFHRIFFRTEHMVCRRRLPMVKGVMIGECLGMSQQNTCLPQGRKKQLGLGNGCQNKVY